MPGGYNAGSVYAEASLDISKFKAAAAQMGGDTEKIVAAMDKAAAGLAKAQSSLDMMPRNPAQRRRKARSNPPRPFWNK